MARKKDQASRREQLIAATGEALLQRGVAGARLKDIAQEAGLTSAAVLYYYPDVQELFTAVFERGSLEYCERREAQVAAAGDAAERLFACVRSGVPRAGSTEETSRLLYELAPVVSRNAQAAAGYRAFLDRQTSLYRAVLEEGDEAGAFSLVLPAPVLARAFVALEDGYSVDVLLGAMAPDDEERVLLLHARAMTGLLQPAGQPPMG